MIKEILNWLFGRKPQKDLPLPNALACVYRDPRNLRWYYRFRHGGSRYYQGGFISRDVAYSRMQNHKQTLLQNEEIAKKLDRKISALAYRKIHA